MEFSIKTLVNSASYERQAELWAKNSILIAFLVAAYVGIFTDITLGWQWLWVIPALLFGSSILLAMPTMFVHVGLASLASKYAIFIPNQPPKPSGIKGHILFFLKSILGILVIPAEIWVIYEFLKFVGTN